MPRSALHLLLLLLLGSTSAAQAAEWWMITPAVSEPQVVEMGNAASIRGNRSNVSLWTHRFYHEPQGRMTDALIQHFVNCETASLKEGRYVDFDSDGNTIESGDNTREDPWASVAPGTIGELIVRFACESPSVRKSNFIKVDPNVDYRGVAKFFLERGELISRPVR